MYAEYFPPERRHDPEVQDIHRLVQCAGAPDTMWVQHHNGVFRSTDAARSWQEVTTIMDQVNRQLELRMSPGM